MNVSFIGYVLFAILAHLVWSELICNPFHGMCEGIFLKLEMVCCQFYETIHSRAGKTLMRNQSLFMGPSQGQRAMLGHPEFVFWEILANGGGQKKLKN